MFSPIIIFTYNRIDHIKRLLDSLLMNQFCAETDVFIFADGPKNEKDSSKVKEVQNFIKTYENAGRFKSWNCYLSNSNNGLANSVIQGVTRIINEYGKVIVLEDDLIVSTSFLNFMNEALDFYEKNEKVWSISGYTFPLSSFRNYSKDVYMILRGCSWGWATWKDRWDKVDWNVSDYNHYKFSLRKRKDFSRGGNDLPAMLDTQMAGFINSWAIRWCYQQYKENMFTIYPCISKVQNGGMDGSGTHSENTTAFSSIFNDSKAYVLENVYPDPIVEAEFRSKYNRSKWSRIKTFVKYVILKYKK